MIMGIRQDTIWEQFLKPIFRLIIDDNEIKKLSENIDWEHNLAQFTNPNIIYPDYYKTGNFHGIEGGYLTKTAAITYDPITKYVLPPNEIWVREALIDKIRVKPQSILDLGCGTGSTTLMLQEKFPIAQVIGLDLSPYMLIVADYKAREKKAPIKWVHCDAKKTNFQANNFDLITVSLLFHETPVAISQLILQECLRILKPGGELIILDGNQTTLRQTEWLNNVFEEPYIKDYANSSLESLMGRSGFENVQTDDIWIINQVTKGIKPLPVSDYNYPEGNFSYSY
jgi:ubiquinone/menaquinone biosynthesis C-methylase UbiE